MNNKLTKNEIIENIKEFFSSDLRTFTGYENEFDIMIDCLFDKNIKRVFPLNDSETIAFRERVGINNDMTPRTYRELVEIFGFSTTKYKWIEGKALFRLGDRIFKFSQMLKLADAPLSKDIQKLMFVSPNFDSFIEHLNEIESISQNTSDSEKNIVKEMYDKSISLPISLDNLDLTVRTRNCLIRGGIKSVADLIQHPMEKFKRMRNLGDESYNELVDKIHSLGLSFQEEIESKNPFTPKNETNLEVLFKRGVIDTRTSNCLRRAGKSTIEDVLMMSQKEFLSIRNFGIKEYENLVEKMHSLGFEFKDEQKEEGAPLTTTDNVETITQRRNELILKGKQLTSEKDALLKQESELDSRIASVVQNKGNIQSGVQNGTTKK